MNWTISGVVWRKCYNKFLKFQFYAIFWLLKVQKLPFFGHIYQFGIFQGPKNRKKSKFQKSGEAFSSNYPWECPVQILDPLDGCGQSYKKFCKFLDISNWKNKRRMDVFPPKIEQFSIFLKILSEINKTHTNTYTSGPKISFFRAFFAISQPILGSVFLYLKYKRKVLFLDIPSRTKMAAESCHGNIFQFCKKIPKAR